MFKLNFKEKLFKLLCCGVKVSPSIKSLWTDNIEMDELPIIIKASEQTAKENTIDDKMDDDLDD